MGRIKHPDYSWTWLLGLALLVGLINLFPLITITTSGDLVLSKTQILCFSEQFWQGYLYPRWCMEANMELGSPILLFYMPLPFYLSAFLYPLKNFGLTLDHIYLLSVFTLNFITFLTCSLWLKDRMKPAITYFCAFLLLWIPYRMEIVGYRLSYAELCGMAFLPLLFLYTRQLIEGHKKVWPKLSLVVAICLLSHAPATLIGLMGMGIQLLVSSCRQYKKLLLFVASVALGFLMTLFHWPAPIQFATALNNEAGGIAHWQKSWLNSYVAGDFYSERALLLLALFFVSALVLFLFYFIRKEQRHIKDIAIKKETLGWALAIIWAIALMFPLSAPLWSLIEMVSRVKTPWRMNLLVSFGCIYLLGTALQIAVSTGRKIRPGDVSVFTAFWLLLGMLMIGQITGDPRITDRLYSNNFIAKYALPKWVAGENVKNQETFSAIYGDRLPRAEFLRGQGKAEVTQWNYDGIHIITHSPHAATLRVRHFYFPPWHATIDGKPATLIAEEHNGRMLIDVPAGNHELRLWVDAKAALPTYYRYICLLSLAVAGFVGYQLYRGRRSASASKAEA